MPEPVAIEDMIDEDEPIAEFDEDEPIAESSTRTRRRTATTTQGNMPATDLHRLLHNALLFAGKDPTLPMIERARLEFGTDQVLSVATDRFMLGVTRGDYSGAAMVVQLDRADVENLAKIAKTRETWEREPREVQIDRTDSLVTFTFTTGESIALTNQDDKFPPWRHLLPSELEEGERFVGVAPAKLATFTKVLDTDRVASLTVTMQGPERPVLVKVGALFVGLLMPVRGDDHGPFERPDWIDAVCSASGDTLPNDGAA